MKNKNRNRRLISTTDEGRIEIIYSKLSNSEIEKRIKDYERRYKMSYDTFFKNLDCDDATIEEIGDYMDWRNLEEELMDRVISGNIKIQLRSKEPLELSDLVNGVPRKRFYERFVLPLYRKGIVRFSY